MSSDIVHISPLGWLWVPWRWCVSILLEESSPKKVSCFISGIGSMFLDHLVIKHGNWKFPRNGRPLIGRWFSIATFDYQSVSWSTIVRMGLNVTDFSTARSSSKPFCAQWRGGYVSSTLVWHGVWVMIMQGMLFTGQKWLCMLESLLETHEYNIPT